MAARAASRSARVGEPSGGTEESLLLIRASALPEPCMLFEGASPSERVLCIGLPVAVCCVAVDGGVRLSADEAFGKALRLLPSLLTHFSRPDNHAKVTSRTDGLSPGMSAPEGMSPVAELAGGVVLPSAISICYENCLITTSSHIDLYMQRCWPPVRWRPRHETCASGKGGGCGRYQYRRSLSLNASGGTTRGAKQQKDTQAAGARRINARDETRRTRGPVALFATLGFALPYANGCV